MSQNDFFTQYLAYVGKTESPTIFHRWCALSGVGAMLGRNAVFQHGHFNLTPNMYVMLLGKAGVRKSSAIKLFKRLLIASGYDTIAADRTTKEKFLLDLSGEDIEDHKVSKTNKNILDTALWGEDETEISSRPPAECFIMADEWNDFTTLGNLEFYSLLGNLWDYHGIFENRIKTGRSVHINEPTISILAGNTPTGFSLSFPTESIGQGFFSRLVLVHGEEVGYKITFPTRPEDEATAEIVARLIEIRTRVIGQFTLNTSAESLIDKIYSTYTGLDDARFEAYSSRRLQHLLKLCMVIAAGRLSLVMTEQDVILANTILTHTEHGMPKALGEFGKGKNSDVTNRVVDILAKVTAPMPYKKLYELVRQDLDKQSSLQDILNGLATADKIQAVGNGFMIKKKLQIQASTDTVDYSLLTLEERGLK